MGKPLTSCLLLRMASERTDDDFWHAYTFFNHGSIQEVFRVIPGWEIKTFVLGRQGESDEALRHEDQRLANAG